MFIGYESLPIDPMEGLELESQSQNSNFTSMDVSESAALDFEQLDDLPAPSQNTHPLSGWYDTDL